jgi:hypothetical protein
MKLFYKAIAVLTALLIVVPLLMVKASADVLVNLDRRDYDPATLFSNMLANAVSSRDYTVNIIGTPASASFSLNYYHYTNTNNEIFDVNWSANAPNSPVTLIYNNGTVNGGTFTMSSGIMQSLIVDASVAGLSRIEISKDAVISDSITINGGTVYIEYGNEILNDLSKISENGGVYETFGAPADSEPADSTTVPESTPEPEPSTPPEPSSDNKPLEFFSYEVNDPLKEHYIDPEIEIKEEKFYIENGMIYYGTVDILGVDSDTPQEIPSTAFIGGKRYAVGDVVYIVGESEKKIEATADTGFSYVFTAVENSENPVKFTAEGLPEGFIMTEDGVITTTILPAPVGTFEITVTADNGLDTNEYKMTIEIKEGGLSDKELLTALTENDVPELLTEPQESIPGVWTNDELTIHYEPEIEDFNSVFLDGKLLEKDVDYGIKEGSTVIILTEQTMTTLPQGDHVVTTMFNQNSDVGLDTVINDVGSSSFVFRFGDEKTSGKRVNIGGDGISGSVTFDDTKSKEEPITTITANTEAIEERAANLSNATGREIIAAFETKQHGGFGGKTATFAISAKSLGLSLKNGTAVYVAVYDSTTDKTYQNKGEVKDGMIVFRTKHSGVFMVSTEKF